MFYQWAKELGSIPKTVMNDVSDPHNHGFGDANKELAHLAFSKGFVLEWVDE